jgi:hypothetical protein
MAIFGAGNISIGQLVQQATSLLKSHRDILAAITNLHDWVSAQSTTDLEGLGISAADLGALLAAIADAAAEAQIHNTGLPPSTYPQPASAYVYAASQRQIVGPQ